MKTTWIIIFLILILVAGVVWYFLGMPGWPKPETGAIEVTHFPKSVKTGRLFDITWQVNSPQPLTIPHTAIHYGPESKPDISYPNFTQEFNSGSFDIPNVFVALVTALENPGKLYFRAHAVIEGENVWTKERVIDIQSALVELIPPSLPEAGSPLAETSPPAAPQPPIKEETSPPAERPVEEKVFPPPSESQLPAEEEEALSSSIEPEAEAPPEPEEPTPPAPEVQVQEPSQLPPPPTPEPTPPSSQPSIQEFNLEQSVYPGYFSPDPLIVKKGRPVRILATTKQREHINRISIQPWISRSETLLPGKITVIEFTPDQAGEFEIRNIGHGFIGILKVIE
ncbi:hypothetical protein MYX07_04410 [Patescibacteria group bacterium AH-259-L07]|nr:hypothetical protein [Patescibacteria group bacterium AH-259-L07]